MASQKEYTEEYKEKVQKLVNTFVPYDPRFPNTNQTRNCQQNYIDYFKCLKKKDADYCSWYKHVYSSICPPDWVERWDDQRANGTFPFPDLCD